MQQIFTRSYDFNSRPANTAVMAQDSISGRWTRTTLGDVRVYSPYDKFYFIDEVEDEVDEETCEEDATHLEQARQKVNEMIDWICMWSVRADAVTQKLNEFRDEIFEHLDEVEEELDW